MNRSSELHLPVSARRGLTLIELLVVIGVIALLAAILFPVFGRVRENSRKSSCASNLKQIGTGFLQYIRDFDDKFPHSAQMSDPVGGGWVPGGGGANPYPFPVRPEQGAIYSYVKNAQVYQCPSDTNAKTKGLSYTMSMLCSYKRLSAAYKTSQTTLLVDESATLNDGNFNPQACGGNDVPTYIHTGGANLCFLDGHVKWVQGDSLKKEMFRFTQTDCP